MHFQTLEILVFLDDHHDNVSLILCGFSSLKETVSKQYQFGYKPKVRLVSPATGKILASLHHVCEVCWLSSWFRAVGKSMGPLSYLTCSRVHGIGYKRCVPD